MHILKNLSMCSAGEQSLKKSYIWYVFILIITTIIKNSMSSSEMMAH